MLTAGQRAGQARGLVHGSAGPPSKAHTNLAPTSPVNANGGPPSASTGAAGGVVSTRQTCSASVLRLPARSTATAVKRCSPSATSCTAAQRTGAPSSAHRAPGVTAKRTLVAALTVGGAARMRGPSGAVVSTTHA